MKLLMEGVVWHSGQASQSVKENIYVVFFKQNMSLKYLNLQDVNNQNHVNKSAYFVREKLLSIVKMKISSAKLLAI